MYRSLVTSLLALSLTACTFAYLPIDRINDYEPSNIKIFSGATEVYVAP